MYQFHISHFTVFAYKLIGTKVWEFYSFLNCTVNYLQRLPMQKEIHLPKSNFQWKRSKKLLKKKKHEYVVKHSKMSLAIDFCKRNFPPQALTLAPSILIPCQKSVEYLSQKTKRYIFWLYLSPKLNERNILVNSKRDYGGCAKFWRCFSSWFLSLGKRIVSRRKTVLLVNSSSITSLCILGLVKIRIK